MSREAMRHKSWQKPPQSFRLVFQNGLRASVTPNSAGKRQGRRQKARKPAVFLNQQVI